MKEILQTLNSQEEDKVCAAAKELFTMGVRKFGNATRGTSSKVAKAALSTDQLEQIKIIFSKQWTSELTKGWLIAALSQWGGENEAKFISNELEQATGKFLRFCIESLETLGGSDSMNSLVWVLICTNDSRISRNARSSLFELAMNGGLDITAVNIPGDFIPALQKVDWDKIVNSQLQRPALEQCEGWKHYIDMIDSYLPKIYLPSEMPEFNTPPAEMLSVYTWENVVKINTHIFKQWEILSCGMKS